MRRFDDLQPDEMPEAMRAAVRDHERETEQARDRAAFAEAAEELGISSHQLDRAAADLHLKKVEEVRRARRLRNMLLSAGVAVLALGAGYRVLNPPPPDPIEYRWQTPSQTWSGEVNARSTARALEEGGSGVIQVERFVAEDDGRYWANLNTASVPESLEGYRTVTLRIRGEGTLRHARLFLENGPTERWRSPDIAVGPEWRTVTLRLEQFEHQTRDGGGDRWRTGRGGSPDDVTELSLKTGHPFNPPDARGRVQIDDLRIE